MSERARERERERERARERERERERKRERESERGKERGRKASAGSKITKQIQTLILHNTPSIAEEGADSRLLAEVCPPGTISASMKSAV